jgi:alpha-2-macroglobulin
MYKRVLAGFVPFFLFFVIVSLACSAPVIGGKSQPTSTPTAITQPAAPTPTPRADLPPTLVDTNPARGGEAPLEGPLLFTFNQAMDKASVEAAFQSTTDLSGRFEWQDDKTFGFYPDEPLSPDVRLAFTIESSAQASNGKGLLAPVNIEFQTVGFLRLSQALPEPNANNVNPAAAVVAAFNRPVVPLGVDPASQPPAFRLEPLAAGRGEWLNTSTYIFYPEKALVSGFEYRVILTEGLAGIDSAPLDGVGIVADPDLPPDQAYSEWTFRTALPKIIGVSPDENGLIDLDQNFSLTFNQPMDTASTEANFRLEGPEGNVSGLFTWDENFTTLYYTPTFQLNRNTQYTLYLSAEALSAGGTPLGEELQAFFSTYPSFRVAQTIPEQNGFKPLQAQIEIFFSSPPQEGDLLPWISISPDVPNLYSWWSDDEQILRIGGEYNPATVYTLTISAELSDQWGMSLAEPFLLQFSTSDYPAQLNVPGIYRSQVLFLSTQDRGLAAQAMNLSSAMVTTAAMTLDTLFELFQPGQWGVVGDDIGRNPVTQESQLNLPPNRLEDIVLPFNNRSTPLEPGLYHIRLQSQSDFNPPPFVIVVSDIHMVFKASATDALVWAVRLADQTPLSGAPVTIFSAQGEALVSGITDEQGIFRGSLPPPEDGYLTRYAVISEPGENNFSLALSAWDQSLPIWNMNIPYDYTTPRLNAYFYTDRPIYRPGQSVFVRGILRQAYNGRYALPDLEAITVFVSGENIPSLVEMELPVSEFGTIQGEIKLPENIQPGYYYLSAKNEIGLAGIGFQVADYRKPELEVQVAFDPLETQAGNNLNGQISAAYYFGPPAADVTVTWTLSRYPEYFILPGYITGPQDTSPYQIDIFSPLSPGIQIDTGTGITNAEGQLFLELSPEAPDMPGVSWRYTLEATLTDESGLPVSGRSDVVVHAAEYYIGVQPSSWFARAGEPAEYEIMTVDWAGNPAPNTTLTAALSKVVWLQTQEKDPFGNLVYAPQYTPVEEQPIQTDDSGKAKLNVTPPEPGTYQLTVSGGNAQTDLLIWVSGGGIATWPTLPNNRLELTADQQEYKPGETASVFIPNPFNEPVQALVTVERGVIFDYEVLDLSAAGETYSVDLEAESAPNVYLTVLLLGSADFRFGVVNLPVIPVEQTLVVELNSQPQRAGPGDELTINLRVTDHQGAPVQGEFSIAVVDKAVLALADANSIGIVEHYYREQPLGVRTGISLAAYTGRAVLDYGGGGGGGMDELIASLTRGDFRDTAYWTGALTTDTDGRAQVRLSLPDNLTTWQVQVRGLTQDTRVGQAEIDVLVTKDLLVRPVTPRFLVLGDRVQMAAVVQNNTDQRLETTVGLQAQGLTLEDPAHAEQVISLPPGGRERVTWWSIVQDVTQVDLVFFAQAGALQDASRPIWGALPVLRYNVPQTFGTSGVIDRGGEQLEVVSLPTSFTPQGGELRVELAPSLSATMLETLEVLENAPLLSTEQILSSFLPNLETWRTIKSFGLEQPELESRLKRTLEEGLGQLITTKNQDGGWSWWPTKGVSDPYVTAYVLYGLTRLDGTGGTTTQAAIERAASYLTENLVSAHTDMETWQLDRLAFELFALAQVGENTRSQIQDDMQTLAALRERLNPWAAAFLMLSFDPGSAEAEEILNSLQTTAARSATGAHWLEIEPSLQNMSTSVYTTSVVIYALAQRDPASTLLPDAVRYVISHRGANGSWASTYESAWTIMALTEVMKGTGELSGDFGFSATVNDLKILDGNTTGETWLTAVSAAVPLDELYARTPNALVIQRDEGSGRLYYNAHLTILRPVEELNPLNHGMSIQRLYFPIAEDCPQANCSPVTSGKTSGLTQVRLTLNIPEDGYYVVVEDYLPAGAEILDSRLKTSQFSATDMGEEPAERYNPRQPFAEGWGWWLFNDPAIFDDHITWTVDYLPAGTYELTYTIVMTQPGEYRVLPAQAYQMYFPEVRGSSAGDIFVIESE